MPNFLRLPAGRTELVIGQKPAQREDNHWLGNQPKPCTGPGCKLCIAEMPRRARFTLDVQSAGQDYVLTLTEKQYQGLIAAVGGAQGLPGARVAADKSGAGVNTVINWTVLAAGAVSAAQPSQPVTYPTPVVSADAWDHVVAELRRLADWVEHNKPIEV